MNYKVIFLGLLLSMLACDDNEALIKPTAYQLTVLEAVPLLFLLLILISIVNFLTEITSNLATTAMLLTVLASLAEAININPYFLLVGATVAASCFYVACSNTTKCCGLWIKTSKN